MKTIIERIIVWSYIILSLAAFICSIIQGNIVLGVAGIVTLNLSALVIFLGGEE